MMSLYTPERAAVLYCLPLSFALSRVFLTIVAGVTRPIGPPDIGNPFATQSAAHRGGCSEIAVDPQG